MNNGIIGASVMLIGLVLFGLYVNWIAAIALYLCFLGNNLEQNYKRKS